ncbi:MMPL family transporter [Microbacterium panaciterrae]|uniref:MMPL family transporter n=1 Tax=Microbacterium panaciterrae TaxID=985759 RepID=A0ABP8PUQ9_9MICO
MPRLLSRVGLFSARHRILVTSVWVVVFASLSVLMGIAITSPAKGAGSSSMPSTAASKALDVLDKEFPSTDNGSLGKSLQLVIQAIDGRAVTTPAVSGEIESLLHEASSLPHATSVTNPFDQAKPFISKSKSTAVATIQFSKMSDATGTKTYDKVVDFAKDAPSNLKVLVGGALVPATSPPFGPGEIVGILVAFLVLILTFGALRVAGANMLAAISGVAVGTAGILGVGAFYPIQDTTLTLANMLGLAVGIDYCLFILTRFGSELRDGRSVEESVGRAVGTAGTAVVFAGLTVIIALLGLSVVNIGFITEMGVAGAFGVLIAVLMSLTLLPVILRSLGRRALPKRERVPGLAAKASRRGRRSFLRGWANVTVKHPVLSILAGVVALAIVALPMLSMKTASSLPGGIDPSSMERKAYNLVVDEFGGVQSPLIVLAEGQNIGTKTTAIQDELGRLAHVQAVVPGTVNTAGDIARITVIPDGGPIDQSTKDLVAGIRVHAGSVSGVHLEVTGETAIGIDSDDALHQALIEYLIVIVGLSLVLMVLLFRSLLLPLVATAGFLLSLAASFGASVAVFQWGWLDALIPAPQGDPMLSMLPIILVGIMFGLAMDYTVFLGTRIQEMYRRGLNPKEAIVEGFTKSAPVLVAAALIMATVFAGFATSPMTVAASIAFGLFAGVLTDALIVRMILMPAALSLLGRSAWWIPKWLDRVLPNLDAEGHSLNSDEVDEDSEEMEPVLAS